MNRQETVQKIFDRQKWIGNSSISKNDIALILEELNRKSVHLLKRKDMLFRQKIKVDNDLKKTEEEIKRTTARLENIVHDDKHISISMKKQKSKRSVCVTSRTTVLGELRVEGRYSMAHYNKNP